MNILFLAFANDPAHPLAELKREEEQIMQALAPRQMQNHFLVHRESFAGIEGMARYISLYREELVVFHYSGHAGPTAFYLDGEEAKARGIAQLLGQCPNLKLVFLNGCATRGQIKMLAEAGVPLIIGTHRPVEDVKAGQFAIQLYQALANNETVGQAFELALGGVLSRDDQVSVVRAIRYQQVADSSSGDDWLLFGEENARSWKLPSFPYYPKEFMPNELLLDKLVESLAGYDEATARIHQLEETGMEVSILDRREAILKALPYPISEHIRKLLVPDDAPTAQGGSSNQLTPERLRQMVIAYQTVIELFTFIFLSQLWEEKKARPDWRLDDVLLQKIRDFLQLGSERRSHFDFVDMIRSIGRSFEAEDIDSFLIELDGPDEAGAATRLAALLEEGGIFCRACSFMQSLWRQTSDRRVSEQEAAPLCKMAEENLAAILGELAFIVRYTFASVKGIDVIKYRHWDHAQFNHRIVRLVQRFVGLAEEPDLRPEFLDNVSVLLLRFGDQSQQFLNLTPFVIDENAFNPKANIAKIHFFERYLPVQDAYVFRHIYKPEDMPLVVGTQKVFKILKAQFDAFAQQIFDHKMREAI